MLRKTNGVTSHKTKRDARFATGSGKALLSRPMLMGKTEIVFADAEIVRHGLVVVEQFLRFFYC